MIAPPFPAPADALAVTQAADCVTTAIFTRQGSGFERNPIARVSGAAKSLPLCLLEAGAVNLALRHFDKTRGQWVTKTFATLEAAATLNNVRIIVRFKTP